MNEGEKPKKLLSMEEAIFGLKSWFKVYCSIAVFINLIFFIGGVYVHLIEHKEFKYSSFETCLYGMNQIINNNPSRDLINEKVISDLKKVNFKVDRIHLIKVINNYTCDVFIKDSKGVRRYFVTLEKNSKFKHLYKILDVKGKKLDSRYQL